MISSGLHMRMSSAAADDIDHLVFWIEPLHTN